MKKIILLIIAGILLIFKTGYTQEKPFKFGFKVAPNIGWMKPDSKGYHNEKTNVGFSWGFLAEFHLMENYAITTGFSVVYLNSTLKYPHTKTIYTDTDTLNINGSLHRKYNLKYIEVPLALKMKTKEFGKVRFYGQIGLSTGFLIGAKAKDSFVSPETGEINSDNDIKDEVKSVREALILGIGMEYSLGGSTALTFGINFDNGFTDVLKDQNTIDPDINNHAINNFLEINMGVIF